MTNKFITLNDSTGHLPADVETRVNALAQAIADALTAADVGASPTEHSHTHSDISDFTEAVQDAVGAMLVSGGTLTLSYDDNAGTVTITGTGTDAESVRDTIGAAIVGVNGVGVAINDALDTITLSISGLTISQTTGLQTALDAKAPLTEAINTVAATGSTETLPDVTTATIHDLTLDANCTLTFPTAAAGKSFTLLLTQDATGSRTVTWPASVKWASATAPTLSTGAGKKDLLAFVCINGTNWIGTLAALDVR